MVDLPDARRIHEAAERAAMAGDLASAEELLRQAARLQEAELGALHPDLANTLNNLAIVTEKTGRLDEAEAFYRRAAAIASASLPADDPMVAASRQNLEDFCRARGLPIDPPAPVPAAAPVTAPDVVPRLTLDPTPVQPPAAVQSTASITPLETAPPADRKGSGSLGWIGLGAVVLAAAFFLWRSQSPRETPAPAPVTQPSAPQVSAPAPAAPAPAPATPAPVTAAPVERPAPPAVAPSGGDRESLKPSADAITLAAVQLCQTFATSGGSWQCDPAANPASAGTLVLLTRVRSPRDAEVVHRWYRGDELVQSVKLVTRANPTEGYRTYSRQTADSGSDWRVEVRSADGELLHEQRFTVR